jgi:CRP-like cAMP-binding protein
MSTELRQALKSIEGFSALPDPALDQLALFAGTRVVRAGETIFCQGEPSPYCFGVFLGEIVIQRLPQEDRFPPAVLGVGRLFGESAIFGDGPRTAMASARKDGKLVVLRAAPLRVWIQENPVAARPLLLALSTIFSGPGSQKTHGSFGF